MFGADPTYISWLIGALFVLFSLHAGTRSWQIAAETEALHGLLDRGETLFSSSAWRNESLTGQFIYALVRRIQGGAAVEAEHASNDLLVDVYVENVRGQHEMGWFVAGILLKLGLLGTVIGFIMMLRSVVFSDSFEMSDVQDLLGNMTVGMGVALTTTLVGLVTSALLGFQYLLVDRGADRLVAQAIFFSETELRDRAPANGDTQTTASH